MEKIILFGNGQVAEASYLRFLHDPSYQVVAFTVDQDFITDEEKFELPVVPFETIQSIYSPADFKLHISISYRKVNQLRAEKYMAAKAKGYQLVSYISPHADLNPEVVIGDNCVIGSHTIIDAGVQIGNNIIIASGIVIGHHTSIGDHCFISAGATIAGSVTLEPYCFIGTGAIIRDRLKVRESSVVGAGALILEDTEASGVYLGRQAQKLSITSDQLPLG
jgi:sugar O-acyltransferase (sialic acid O-acetyltransferase NeuD family)